MRDQTADTLEAGGRRVSPLRAADRRRYPRDWPEISKAIRFDRAGGQCECAGECGAGHEGRCEARHGQPHPVTGSKVVLTTAHRDHQPENCDPADWALMRRILVLLAGNDGLTDAELLGATTAEVRQAARILYRQRRADFCWGYIVLPASAREGRRAA